MFYFGALSTTSFTGEAYSGFAEAASLAWL